MHAGSIAIQVVTGCSVGKGNLIFRDLGKAAYTFIDRKNKRAIRLVQHKDSIKRIDPEADILLLKLMGGTATKRRWGRISETAGGRH